MTRRLRLSTDVASIISRKKRKKKKRLIIHQCSLRKTRVTLGHHFTVSQFVESQILKETDLLINERDEGTAVLLPYAGRRLNSIHAALLTLLLLLLRISREAGSVMVTHRYTLRHLIILLMCC